MNMISPIEAANDTHTVSPPAARHRRPAWQRGAVILVPIAVLGAVVIGVTQESAGLVVDTAYKFVVALLIWARGPQHHHGHDVGALGGLCVDAPGCRV